MRIHAFSAAALAAVSLVGVANAQQYRVALTGAAGSIGACQWTDPQAKLLATGLFAAVDILPAMTTTPTLAQLRAYDAVMVWTNVNLASGTAMGDVLADYVDEGGGVVVTVFANSVATANRFLGGRWQTGYEVILDQGGGTSTAATLGTVHDPFHPVMAGVSTFAGTFRPTMTALEVGSTLIAEWSDGKVLVAQGLKPNRVDLGFYPPSSTCSSTWWTGDGALMMANALVHVAHYSNYHPYGSGCTGSLGVPTLEAATGYRPFVGGPFQVDIGNAPLGIAIMVLGFSDTTSGGIPLPLDLGVIGMPGCNLLAELNQTFFLVGAPPTVSWSVTIPLDAVFFGAFFYNQAAVADPGINPMNLTATNGGRARIGV